MELDQEVEGELNAFVALDDDDVYGGCECHDTMGYSLVCDDSGARVRDDFHAYDHDDCDDCHDVHGVHVHIQVLEANMNLADEHALKQSCHQTEMANPTMCSMVNEDEDSKLLEWAAKHWNQVDAAYVICHPHSCPV